MFCPKCGAQNPDGARFCGGCGNEIPAPAKTAAPVATTAQPVVATAAATPAAAPTLYQPKAIKSRTPLIAGIVGVLVLAAIGFGVYTLFFSPYTIDEKTFPDASLRAAVTKQLDVDGDGKITRDEAKSITALNLSGSGVTSLEGLQLFENLHSLDLSGTSSLIQADFSKAKNLTALDLSNSALINADISSLSNLQTLNAAGAAFTELNVAKNTKLSTLRVDEGVAVSGLASTNLREQYLISKVETDGYAGTYDGQGGGGGYDRFTLEFTYDGDNHMTSRNQRSEYTYSGKTDVSNYGARYTYENGLLKTAESTGSNYTTLTYDYNEAKQLTNVRSVYHGSSSNSTSSYNLMYNDAGLLAEVDSNYSSGSSTRTFSYNDARQYISSTTSSSSSSSGTSVTYDGSGRISQIRSSYQEMNFSYNDTGALVTKTYYWLDGKGGYSGVPVVVNFSYDEQGRVVYADRSYSYDTNTSYYTGEIEYDSLGRIAKVTHHYESTYPNSKPMTGTQTFTYKRVFTAKDAPDVVQPVLVGDPSHTLTVNYPWRPDLYDDNQSEIAVCGAMMVDYYAIMV